MVGIRCVLSDKMYGDKCQIFLRATITRTYRPMLKTEIYVNPKFFRNGKIVDRVVGRVSEKNRQEVSEAKRKLDLYCQYLEKLVHAFPEKVTDKRWLKMEMQKCRYSIDNSNVEETDVSLKDVKRIVDSNNCQKPIYEYLDEYVSSRGVSKQRGEKFTTLKRRLIKYESFERYMGNDKFRLTPSVLIPDVLDRFLNFCTNEKDLSISYPIIFKAIDKDVLAIAPYQDPERLPSHNGVCQNVCIEMLSDLRSVMAWLMSKSIIMDNPFDQVTIKQRQYNPRPVFISIEERKMLTAFDLHDNAKLEVQRDIFIFHCLVGCRYGDLISLTDDNIVDGSFLQYVPAKTKKMVNHVTPKVPLTEEAKNLIAKYRGKDAAGRLFPFVSNAHYNDCLKEIFLLAGLTRAVQILNPKTRKPESVPLNEYVSSHLARRTFIGNLYNKIKDPNIISAMSGHSEHSRAFSRYRDIGDDVRKDLIDKIK